MANNFQEFSDKAFNTFLEENPVHASSIGLHEYDGKLPTYTMDELDAGRKIFGDLYNELLTFKKEDLSDEEQIEYDFIKWIIESYIFEYDDLEGTYNKSYLLCLLIRKYRPVYQP
jgi:uncharacterized protein (DUF885 family)